MNDSKLMSFNADVTTVVRATDYSDEITRERLLARDDSEHMGMRLSKPCGTSAVSTSREE